MKRNKSKSCYSCGHYDKIRNICSFGRPTFSLCSCELYEAYNKYKRSPKEYRTFNGIVFDSKKEMIRYQILLVLQKKGVISDLSLQPEFILQDKFVYQDKIVRAIKYIADFKYLQDGKTIIEDTKGMKTKEYLIKKKLFLMQIKDDESIEFRET